MAEPAWMLDTNVLSDLIRSPHGTLMRRLAAAVRSEAICTSIVVACELRFGASAHGARARRR